VYPPCPDAGSAKLEGKVLGHGGYTAVELSRFATDMRTIGESIPEATLSSLVKEWQLVDLMNREERGEEPRRIYGPVGLNV
jgi:hypothetical protein